MSVSAYLSVSAESKFAYLFSWKFSGIRDGSVCQSVGQTLFGPDSVNISNITGWIAINFCTVPIELIIMTLFIPWNFYFVQKQSNILTIPGKYLN